jgi:tetratricopeptide (TPR) repeat protein
MSNLFPQPASDPGSNSNHPPFVSSDLPRAVVVSRAATFVHETPLPGLDQACLDQATYQVVTDLIDQRRYSAALLMLAQLPRSEQRGYQFWYLQGSVLANLGRYSEALQSFAGALQVEPQASEALVFQAVCWIHLEQYAAALDCCDRTIALYPQESQAWLFRGVSLQRLGHYKEAYQSYENALNQPRMSLIERLKTWFSHKFGSFARTLSRPAKTTA